MIKREEIFGAALDYKKDSLAKKVHSYELMLHTAYETMPRLHEIDSELTAYGAKIALTALSGDKETLSLLQTAISRLSDEKKGLLAAAQVREINYDCALCKDTGYVGGKVCDCVKQLVKKITVERLNSEMPLADCRFDNFDLNYYPNTEEDGTIARKRMTHIFKLCREYVINFNPSESNNLLFMGTAGLGKTHLTLAVVSGVVERGYEVVYGSAYNLFTAVENEHFSSEKGDSYETMLDCDLLVIDDLGTEFTSPFTQTVLYGLINTRLLTKKPTIINTNLTIMEIEKRYSGRISSRLVGNYIAKKFCGRDVRQLKAVEVN